MFDVKRTLDVRSKLERIACCFGAPGELDGPNGAAAVELAQVEHRTSDPNRLAAPIQKKNPNAYLRLAKVNSTAPMNAKQKTPNS